MDFSTRQKYFNRCRVHESLSPDDDRNLDIDKFTTEPVRGINWVQRLGSPIELSERPVFQLFTGLPGSGKSTELKRLARRLADPERAHLLPIIVDGDTSLDLTNEIDIPDVITAILFAVEQEVLRIEGRNPEEAMQQSYFARLWQWLTQTDIELQKIEYAIPAGPKLVAEMRSRPKLRQRVRSTLASHLSGFLRDAHQELELLERRATACGYRGLIVIFDSLEKLRGTSENWDNVLASAEKIFGGGATYLRLPVHVLYTIPTALINRRFEHVHFIPMIKLADQQGTPYEPGYRVARELIRHRVPDDVIGQLFGPQSEARLRELIRWSGGYPREIVRLLQSALALEDFPLSDDDFQRMFNELKDGYRMVVPADAFPWLAKVANELHFTILNDGHRQIAEQMLLNNVILRYINDNAWFDLHPAVVEIPGIQEAIAKLKSPAQG